MILSFEHLVESDDAVFFAFSYPYSYQRCQDLVRSLGEKYTNHPDFYFHRECLTYSPDLRYINLLTISSYDGILGEDELESHMSEALFPER